MCRELSKYLSLEFRQSHSPLTRARTISVFRQCVTALFMVKDQHPQSVKEAVGGVLPVWLEAFKVLLNIDPMSDVSNAKSWDGLAVRIQIFKVKFRFFFILARISTFARLCRRSILHSLKLSAHR